MEDDVAVEQCWGWKMKHHEQSCAVPFKAKKQDPWGSKQRHTECRGMAQCVVGWRRTYDEANTVAPGVLHG